MLAATLGVSGTAALGAPARHPQPVRTSQVLPALTKYRHYAHHLIAQLVPDVQRLETLLGRREVAAAKSAWLRARLVWLRIGQDNSAYGIFGDLGRRIDGTAAGYPRGVNDPSFTGFHRIEHDLWRRHDVAAATRDAANLVAAVRHLSRTSLLKTVPANTDGATTFILRSHEIIEDALRDTLSGNDEYGSGTALASVGADVAATTEVLKLLTPLIKPRSPGLIARAHRDLSRVVVAAKAGYRDGHSVPIAALSRSDRERLDAAVGAADEELAPIPDLLRIGNT